MDCPKIPYFALICKVYEKIGSEYQLMDCPKIPYFASICKVYEKIGSEYQLMDCPKIPYFALICKVYEKIKFEQNINSQQRSFLLNNSNYQIRKYLHKIQIKIRLNIS
jgi:hypothetical protein